MALKRKSIQQIKEVPWGTYLWQMPNGAYVSDDSGHVYGIFAMEGDKQKIRLLADAVRTNFNINEGQPRFFSGNRLVSDEEYEHQRQRLEWGLTPDPMDISAINEGRGNANRR
jgi:hypothetical protein